MPQEEDSFSFSDFLSGAQGLYQTYTQGQLAEMQLQATLAQQQATNNNLLYQQSTQASDQNLRKNLMIGGVVILFVLIVIWIFQKFLK